MQSKNARRMTGGGRANQPEPAKSKQVKVNNWRILALDNILRVTGGHGCERAIDTSAADTARQLAIRGTREWGKIAFVGEGENSGRIMTGADVGIAMGSLGSDHAFACADVLVMDRDIFKIPKTLVISRTAYITAWENLGVGIGSNALLILLGTLGVITPLAAEIASFAMCAALLGNTLRIK